MKFPKEPQHVFTWSPEVQNLMHYTLRLEMTFTWIGEDLSIIAKLNDYAEFGGYLGIVFFELTTYSTYDKAYALFVHNVTIDVGALSLGGYHFGFPSVIPKPSPYHNCTYNNEMDYTTFDILFRNHNPDKTHIHVT